MPLLGAIGNASEYSFRGTYDNYPFDIDFGNLTDAEPGQTYITSLKLVKDINYKVPISITGDGEYYVGNITFDKTFDNNYITLDQTPTTFDATFPELNYSTQPNYVRDGNTVGLRIIGAAPGTEIGTEYYGKTYNTTITIGKKEFNWSVTTKLAASAKNLIFVNQNNVGYSSEIISNEYVVEGLTDSFNYNAEITSNQGLLSVNNQNFVRSSTVSNNDTIRLKLNSSSLNFSTTSTTLKIALATNPTTGSATTTWSITTLDSIPSNLSFTNVLNAELNSQTLSDIITIQGLSDNINFNISITSIDGLLSVNNQTFVKSATIKNGDKLQLRVDTSSVWLEEKNVVVKLADTSTSWNVKNRTIQANSDVNAGNLIYAIPFNALNQAQDMSPEIRLKSSLAAGTRAQSEIYTYYQNQPNISTDQSKYYNNIGSLKLAKGTTTKTFETTFVRIDTNSTQSLGYSDFTVELWMRFSEFGFGGESGMSIFYPSYIDSKNINDYFFQLFVKGDNWPNTSEYKRGLLLGYPDSNGVVQTICETTSQVLSPNFWNHIALTRSGNTFFIWVNGIARASGNRSMELTSTGYNFAVPNFQRLILGDVNIQDLRLYRGIAKYTSNFNTSNVTSVMEQYTS